MTPDWRHCPFVHIAVRAKRANLLCELEWAGAEIRLLLAVAPAFRWGGVSDAQIVRWRRRGRVDRAGGRSRRVAAANAESVMKQCGDQWQAAKAAGTTNGETWPQFLSQCRAQLKTGGTRGACPRSADVCSAAGCTGPRLRPGARRRRDEDRKPCDAEYAANKAAIKASGQTQARVRRRLPRGQRDHPARDRRRSGARS